MTAVAPPVWEPSSSSTPAVTRARCGSAGTTRTAWSLLSLWRGRECTGTFRLAIDEVPVLIEALRAGPRRGVRGRR